MRRAPVSLAVSMVLAAAGCRGSGGSHEVGATSFESPPPGGASAGGGVAAAGAAAPAAPGVSSAAPARTIEEADIYKRVGGTLYVLNAYRGLQIVDLADASAPRLLARVPLAASPVDLYVRGTTALVLVRDWLRYLPVDGGTRPDFGSRLLAIDVSDPANPSVVADLALEGQVDQTRLVGDVLYVVSRTVPWYPYGIAAGVPAAGSAAVAVPVASGAETIYVASFGVADPLHPAQVARVEFPAAGWSTHANVTEERITLSFAGWGGEAMGPFTRFRAIDISDPGGALALGAEFTAPGTVQDRWGMDFDGQSGVFRAVLAAGWSAGATVATWSAPAAGAATPLATLDLPIQESLTAARFDGPRVYVVTARRTDPLWAIDASDPAHPVLAGSLQMPGQLDFIEPRGDRLVALGHTNEAGQPFQLAVSLLDVSQLSAPRLLARQAFGAGFGWVGAQADDIRKAFIVLDPPPAGPGLVLVPVQGWDPGSYAFTGGTQLLDLGHDALALRGFLAHPGAVLRSFPLDDAGARLAALSDAALQTIDASNRDAPAELARLDLARTVSAVAVVRGAAVELSGDWYRGAAELAVTDAADPDAAAPLARVAVGAPAARMFRDGDVVWLLAHDFSSGRAWLQAVDLADPAHPRQRGRVDLAPEDALGLYPGYWLFGDEAVLVGHALALHRAWWWQGGGQGAGDRVTVVDLADPDHPRVAAGVTIPGSAWSWGLHASGTFLWLTHFEWNPGDALGRYYVDRIDLARPSQPKVVAKVNVPGVFLAASADGRTLHTVETLWPSGDGEVATWVHSLALEGDVARLRASVRVDGYPAGAATSGGHAWMTMTAFTVSGFTANAGPGTRLVTLDLAATRVASTQEVQGGWAWLRAAAGGKLFVQVGGIDDGLLVYGLADPGRPAFEQFFRTASWIWDIAVDGDRAYLPSGPYGVPVLSLAP
jgi:hypothetical protein